MKSWEMEEMARNMGHEEGFKIGLAEGLQEGRQEGLQEGRQEGLQEGRQEGLREGRQEGLREGRQEIIKLVALLAEAGRTEDIIKASQDEKYQKCLLEEFGLSL